MSVVLSPTPSTQDSQLEQAASIFKALSDPARLKILHHLAQSECDSTCEDICACDFEAVTGLSQPTVSHHMKNLLAAGLVSARKEGRWMYYRIKPAGFEVIKTLLPQLGS